MKSVASRPEVAPRSGGVRMYVEHRRRKIGTRSSFA
jgi:hypothetical protein